MDIFEVAGFIAAICTTISFIPQAVKTLRTQHTKDLSLNMYILLTVGITMWLIYGISLKSMPIIIANAVTLLFVVPILIMKIRFK